MDETLKPGMVWEIRLRHQIGTSRDTPYHADSDTHLDWWKRNLMHGIPLEEWSIQQVPDPMSPEDRAWIFRDTLTSTVVAKDRTER